MTKAEEIFEKHIGLNSELGYLPIKKEDVIEAINEALLLGAVISQVCDCTDFDEPTHVIKCKKCGKMYDQSY